MSGSSILGNLPLRHFISVDAESEVLAEGVATANSIRARVERKCHVRIPLIWFIRFQRTWNEYVEEDAINYFTRPVDKSFDGFALGNRQLLKLQSRGDEIAWHYHAYNYAHREDLSHAHKIAVLRADLLACGVHILRCYPEFEVRTFRFGWSFVPDYSLYRLLRRLRIKIDASVQIESAGKKVKAFNLRYPSPITRFPKKIDGTWFVPLKRAHMVHEYELVAHNLGWTAQDEQQASQKRDDFEEKLLEIARKCRETGATFANYKETFL